PTLLPLLWHQPESCRPRGHLGRRDLQDRRCAREAEGDHEQRQDRACDRRGFACDGEDGRGDYEELYRTSTGAKAATAAAQREDGRRETRAAPYERRNQILYR